METELMATDTEMDMEIQDKDLGKQLAMQEMETMATTKEKIGIR